MDDERRWIIAAFCGVIATYLLVVIGAGVSCLVYAHEILTNTEIECDKRDRIMEMLGLVLATVVALLQGTRPPPPPPPSKGPEPPAS